MVVVLPIIALVTLCDQLGCMHSFELMIATHSAPATNNQMIDTMICDHFGNPTKWRDAFVSISHSGKKQQRNRLIKIAHNC